MIQPIQFNPHSLPPTCDDFTNTTSGAECTRGSSASMIGRRNGIRSLRHLPGLADVFASIHRCRSAHAERRGGGCGSNARATASRPAANPSGASKPCTSLVLDDDFRCGEVALRRVSAAHGVRPARVALATEELLLAVAGLQVQ